MVTGTRAFVREMEEAFHPLGAELVALSLIEVRPLWNERIAETLKQLGSYQWIVFTSGNGVELFFALLREQGIDLRRLMQVKFAVIGRKTEEILLRHGFQSDFVPEQFSGADLAAEWIPTLKPDEKVVLFRAENGSRVLTEALAAAGISYDDIGLYETWTDLRRQEELNRVISEVDYVTVASSSAAQALAAMLEPEQRKKLTAKLISIGPSTTKTMEKLGIQELAQAGSIVWRQHIFRAQDLEELAQSFLVIAATSDRAVNDHIVHLCHERHIPVNHAGDQTQCDFQFPAIVQKNPVVIGVNAGGKDHGLVRRVAAGLREWIAREKF